jgi:type IV pilus assembly protein PilX
MRNSKLLPQCMKLVRQRGMTLFIALIGLIAMALAGVALIRSVETSNFIAGNFAFRNAAMHASDVGVEAAYTALDTLISGALDANEPSGCTSGCQYYATMQAVNSLGIPSVVNWSTVTGTPVNSDYTVRYVIERLCSGTLPITNLARDCYSGSLRAGGSKKAGSTVFSSTSELYFRVTVRVEGPRNTISYVQTVLAH